MLKVFLARFRDVNSGFNQMTNARFESIPGAFGIPAISREWEYLEYQRTTGPVPVREYRSSR
jgi:hypothetical protein